jgi:hypothetical protein
MPKFLFKANDHVLSHCACNDQPAMSTGQLDCPWCGCGWLIACSRCRKSFTFAEVRQTNVPLVELGRREAISRGLAPPASDNLTRWAEAMSETLDVFDVGDQVVYLDGAYWTVDATRIEFDGYFAHHELARLPHAEALSEPNRLSMILGSPAYWHERKLIPRTSG